MVLPSRTIPAHRSARLLLFIALMGTLSQALADDAPLQRQELAAALRQLDALERLVEQSAAATPIVPGARYHFDYPRLRADLTRVRAGIQDYLAPSRAQPRDPTELSGLYRTESDPEARP
ncbi:integrative conjugative element protein, RAQPRD family [Marinobacterium rhizophilum]|uniref:RAQPRD family integrative conjugative element protein n=1 Tax=Marinobacterium rhizophilum TaxID=420402 RepID=A0ABY5HLA4_9GAMM|nr:RAQPRD family integrative conjugative element protein [Marinobacterium rhizophilum]UTW12363.1 RAQPRD family integrative conjugative element protein [Marinobacterium rhizophilum]